ncbi:MAG TPA: hypothetical protein PK280_17220 [Planctomycetota bacterium]|nr:hypothetical protein [Planctomycetota bacterium]
MKAAGPRAPRRSRRLADAPFARPPGRRSIWARFAPEWCALGVGLAAAAVYILMLRAPSLFIKLAVGFHLAPDQGVLWLQPKTVSPFHYLAAASLVHGLAGLVLIFAPVAFIVSAWAEERRRGTLEPMLLTSTHHSRAVRGRFRFVALPWMRLALYLLPLHFAAPLLASAFGEGLREYGFGAAPWSVPELFWLGNLRDWYMEDIPASSLHGWLLPALRWGHDVSSLYFAAAVAYFFSIRTVEPRRAAVWSYGVAGLGVFVVLSPDCWWLLGTIVARREDGFFDMRFYWFLVLLAVALRATVSVMLVARVASNFDAYVLGEQPDRK